MRWEALTAADFQEATKQSDVCVLAMGVVEKHGDHLPLGTDFLNGHKIACLAAEKEAAMVFPPFYFGQIYEAKCFPGTITIKPTLLVELVQGVFDEIGRNGFRKIVIYNAHGGNTHFLHFLAQCSLWEEKPYSVYVARKPLGPEREKKWKEICETEQHGHACECETSVSLANHAELVKMDCVSETPAMPLLRMKDVSSAFTGISWYSNFPEHYAGDARPATEEKGLQLRALLVDGLAEFIAAVKKDEVAPSLTREFFERVRRIHGEQ